MSDEKQKTPHLPLSNIIQDIPLNRQVLYPRLLALAVLLCIGGAAAIAGPFITRGLSMSIWTFIISFLLFGAAYGIWWLSIQWAPPNAASFSLLWAGSKNPVTVGEHEANSIERANPGDMQDATLRRVAKILRIEPPIPTETGLVYPNNAFEIVDVKRSDPNNPGSDVQAFSILATSAGAFAQQKNQDHVIDSIRSGVHKGKLLWDNRVDAATDTITFYRKKEFPPAIFPKLPYEIAQSPKEASALFKKNSFLPFGEDAYGQQVGALVEKQPHGFIVGGSGSGKTVYFSQAIEYLRARGCMVMLLDGKFSSFTPYLRAPNIVYTAMDVYDLVWGLAWARRQMQARYNQIQNAGKELSRMQASGQTGEMPKSLEPPLFVILDELDTAKSAVKDTFGKKALDSFMESIADILRLGRQSRVYLILGNQSYYADTLGGQLKANVSYMVTLGEVSARTLQEAFSDENKARARRMSEAIPKTAKGRGIQEVTETDDQGNPTGNIVISEFLTYYGFNLAELEMPSWEPAKTEWTKFKAEVSDRVPQLYPHYVYKRPYPDEAENAPEGTARMSEWFETLKDSDYDILSLLKYETLALDKKNEQGQWEYFTDESITRYDPLSYEYVGDTGADLSQELIKYD